MDLDDLQFVVLIGHAANRNTPAIVAKHAEEVAARWKGSVLYATDKLSATDRSRLVSSKLPFVVPGRQLYLRPLGVDFRERYSAHGTTRTVLSGVAQLIVLSAIHKRDWALQGPTEMARHLSYTKMTTGRAFGEIEAMGLASVHSLGRQRRLLFRYEGRNLWDAAAPLLRSPVKAEAEVDLLPSGTRLLAAGLSALAQLTGLAAPAQSVYATRLLRSRSGRPEGHGGQDRSAKYRLQTWIYDPAPLAEGHRVDRLSLFLSLREIADERVEKALDELLENMPW